MKYLILMLLLTGCAGFHATQRSPELIPYVELYENTYGLKYTGNFYFVDDLGGGILGRGGVGIRGKEIQIVWNYWDELTENQKIWLIFHELTHSAFLHMTHDDGQVMLNGRLCDKSIMNTYLPEDDCFENNKAYYFEELKTHFYAEKD